MCHLKLFRESRGPTTTRARESRGPTTSLGGNMLKQKVPSAPAADANLLAWLKKPRVPLQEGFHRIQRICSPKQANFAKHM